MKKTQLEQNLQQQLLGETLQQAALVNSAQIQVALMEQSTYCEMRIGEIFALHGWISQETVDFFAEFLSLSIQSSIRKKIGNYFYQAGLLDKSQIEEVLKEQAQTGGRFGTIAVSKGFIKPETLYFFLQCLFPQSLEKIAHKDLNDELKSSNSRSQTKSSNIYSQTKSSNSRSQTKRNDFANATIYNYEELSEEGLDDIPWID